MKSYLLCRSWRLGSCFEIPVPPHRVRATLVACRFFLLCFLLLARQVDDRPTATDRRLKVSLSSQIQPCCLISIKNEAKSVAGNHWLRLSPSVALQRGQVWSSLGIRCQQQQLVDWTCRSNRIFPATDLASFIRHYVLS